MKGLYKIAKYQTLFFYTREVALSTRIKFVDLVVFESTDSYLQTLSCILQSLSRNMEKSKKRLVTLIVLCVFGAVVYFVFTKWDVLFIRSKKLVSITKPTKIFIVNEDTKTEAKYVDGAWVSSGFPADVKKINDLLEGVKQMVDSNIVSKNKNKFDTYGIRPDRYIQINDTKIYIGDRYGSIGSYIRINEEALLYAVETDFYEYFYPVDLRNLIPNVVLSEQNVVGLNIENNEQKLSFIKNKEDWVVNNQKANREKINFLINDLKTLNGTDIQKINDVKTATMSAILKISVTEGKKKKNILFYSPNETVVYMLIEKDKYVYTQEPSSLLPFQKTEGDFVDTE